MELQQLMRDSVKDDWGIKELQNCILNIAKDINDFCEENDIYYCLMGGSALGAVRHQGFIPWDDDLDIFMTPQSFAKFKKLFNEKGDKNKYYLQELGACNGKRYFAKVRLNNSEFIEESVANWDIHHGVYIDIMIMHKIPANKILFKWQVFWEYYLNIKALSNKEYSKRGKLFKYALRTLRLTPKRFLLGFSLRQLYKFEDSGSNRYLHLYPSQPLFRSVYPEDVLMPTKLVNFETIQLRVPVNVNEYLTILFGDYMKIPDLKQIRYHQHTKQWSTDHAFTPRKKGIFEDEKYCW